jgi:hypothetical protein
MTPRQQESYQAAVKVLAANHKAEHERKRAEFAAALEETLAKQKEILREIELAHQREWFALRVRFKFAIGAAGRHILAGSSHAHGL